MGFPLFRFTLSNSIAGSLQISEPGGWDDSILKLERHQEFHSLVEYYDQPMTFYGQNSEGNGGLDYIREIERSQGPDAQISILVEVSHDEGTTYETAFSGLIDIPSCKEIDFYKAEYGILRDDFWQKFINRKGTPVNIASATDLDGNAITTAAPGTMTLTAQAMRQSFERNPDITSNDSSATSTLTRYLMFTNAEPLLDEIAERFEYGTQISESLPTDVEKYLFVAQYGGSYLINANVNYAIAINPSRNYDVRWYYATRILGTLTTTQFGSTNASSGTTASSFGFSATLSTTVTLNAGDELYIYGVIILNAAGTITYVDREGPNDLDTTLEILADTTTTNTTAERYLIGDAAKYILSKLTGVYPTMTSSYVNTPGCGAYYALTKGLLVRGYSTSDKPFFMSFDQWWEGANPILNLGLGYVQGADEIEIEKKEDFYDAVPVVNLDFVNFIERGYDTKKIFKSIDVGYQKWSAESGSGIDDPQTVHTYRTRFKTVGEDIKLLSKFYAAGLGIEQTRRNRAEQGRDWRLDEDIMIIAVKKGDTTLPELQSGVFSTVGGILNSTTRYNLRITPARNLLRWANFLNGCLKWYTENDDFVFSSSEGNFAGITILETTDCEYAIWDIVSVQESANIDAGFGHDFLFVPIVYEFEHPLTWEEYKAIRAYRKKAIGVSRTNTNHVPCHILSLEYQMTKGKAKFTVILGQLEPI